MSIFPVRFGKAWAAWGLLALVFAFAPVNTHDQAMASVASGGAAAGGMANSGINLLQFTASGHVLGFSDRGVVVAAGDHAMKTEFTGARRVKPQARGGARDASSKARVTYQNLWDGVTLIYDRDPGGIVRSTYRIAPHAKSANPVKRIRLTYNATAAADASGNLVLGFETGNMVKSAPVAWQEIGGQRVPVDVSFTILAEKESGFHVGAYDPARPLIIDPTLTWNTFLGGSGAGSGFGIAVDAAGNVYVTGNSDATWGAPVRAFSGGTGDAFVAKLNTSGALQWNTFLGGSDALVNDLDTGNGIAVDAAGNVYVTGSSKVSWGTPVRAFGGGISDAFAAKLNTSGVLQWNTFLGSNSLDNRGDVGNGIAVDVAGNVYVTGSSKSTWGTPIRALVGFAEDAFVAKLNTSGVLQWNTFLGSNNGDVGNGIAVDAVGNTYVTGLSSGTWGTPVRAYGGISDAFAAKLNTNGVLVWNTFLGGSSQDIGHGIAVDAVGNVYVTGRSDVNWGAPVRAVSGVRADAFVAKLNTNGVLIWNTFLGIAGTIDDGNGIAVDAVGNAYVTGRSDATWGAPVRAFSGSADAFVAKLNINGVLHWNTFLGGSSSDIGLGIAVDAAGNVDVTDIVYVTGSTVSSNQFGAFVFDAFVAKIGASRTFAGTPNAETTDDPVQVATGEFFLRPQVDINLGGPLPLNFSRIYAARLKTEGVAQSALGDNWIHNFDLRLKSMTASYLDVVYTGGKIISFAKTGANWALSASETTIYQLKQDAAGNFLLLDPSSRLVYLFSPTGVLQSIQDRNGNSLTLTHDVAGNLIQVSDGLGRILSFTYAGGNLTQISDGARMVDYAYTAGVLTSAIDSMGNTTTFLYDTTNTAAGPLMTGRQRPLGNSSYSQTYDANGRVSLQTDAFANAMALQFDTPSIDITTLTDPLGNSRQTTHQYQRQVTRQQDEAGNAVVIAYDANNRRTSVTDRMGNTLTAAYHAPTGYATTITNANGDAIHYTYSAQNQSFGTVAFTFYNLTRIDYPDGTNQQFTFDSRGNILTHTDQAGQLWISTYNAQGLTLTLTNPAGGVTTAAYNADGTQASSTDSDSGITTYGYDALKRLTTITHADGTTIQVAYDQNDRMTSTTDERNNTTVYAYDANGNLITITDAAANAVHFTYDAMDRLIGMTDRLGNAKTWIYDTAGHVASGTDPNGLATTYGYDIRGWRNSTTLGGRTWLTGHDKEGVTTSLTTPLGHSATFQSDNLGYVASITSLPGQTASVTRDVMGRPTSIADPLARTTGFSYDASGSLASVTLPLVNTATYARNSLGLLSDITDLNGQHWSFTRTSMGRLQSRTDPLGNSRQRTYDSLGRRSVTTFADASTLTFSYDNSGNIARMLFSGGTDLQFTYDAQNNLLTANGLSVSRDAEERVTSTTSAAGAAFGATYDSGGRMSTVTYNNGAFTVTYGYDAVTGLLSSVTDSLTNTQVTFTHDNDARLTGITRPNGVNTTLTYDNAARVTRIQDGGIIDLQYVLDAAGRVTQANNVAPLSPTDLFTTATQTQTYDAASQLGSAGYAYDSRGRLTSAPGNAFTWDGDSRLTGAGTAAMAYNGMGDLITRTQGGATTAYAYNYAITLKPVVAEKDAATGQFLRYYAWTPAGRLLYMIDVAAGNKIYHYHFDRTGSTLALTDATGAVADAYVYTPYGKLLGHNGANSQPFTFVGKWGVRQEGGDLYQMRARYYDAGTGRFLNRDPLWPRLTDPRQIAPYNYAANDPIGMMDVMGTQATMMRFPKSRKLAQDQITGMLKGELEGRLKAKFNKKVEKELAKHFERELLKDLGGSVAERKLAKKLAKEAAVKTMKEFAKKANVALLLYDGAAAINKMATWALADNPGALISQELSYQVVEAIEETSLGKTVVNGVGSWVSWVLGD